MQPHNFPVQKMSPFIVQGQQYLSFSDWKTFLYFGTKYFDINNFDTNNFSTNDLGFEKALSSNWKAFLYFGTQYFDINNFGSKKAFTILSRK